MLKASGLSIIVVRTKTYLTGGIMIETRVTVSVLVSETITMRLSLFEKYQIFVLDWVISLISSHPLAFMPRA